MTAAGAKTLVLRGATFGLPLRRIAGRWDFGCLRMSVCAVLLGSVGALMGARLDFGQFGLATIADWCSIRQPLSLVAICNQAALAPWTCVGMLGGCNLGIALSTQFVDQSAQGRPAMILRFFTCNAGMMLGMLLAEVVLPGLNSFIEGVSATVRMLSMMVLGMTAGMWGGWWSAEWVRRGWRRGAFPAALRHPARGESAALAARPGISPS